jgi:hypothetical protein
MKIYEGVDVEIQISFTSASPGGELSPSHPACSFIVYSTVPEGAGDSCRSTGDIGCGIRSFFTVGEWVDGNRGGESGDVTVWGCEYRSRT